MFKMQLPTIQHFHTIAEYSINRWIIVSAHVCYKINQGIAGFLYEEYCDTLKLFV